MTYPQHLSTGVDRPTRRGKCLTRQSYISLYLEQSFTYLNGKLNINKISNTYNKLKYGIALLIAILAINPTYNANANDPSTELYKLYTHMKLGNDKAYRCVVILWRLESHWNPKARNSKSSARGIPQLLKMTENDPYKQIDLGLKYIGKRYNGDTCRALAYHKKHGNY